MTMHVFNDKDTALQSVLDAFPHPVFVVDGDVRVLSFNHAAGGEFEDLSEDSISRRGGELLKCLHVNDTPSGCGGGEACKTCDIRNSVRKALGSSDVVRARVKLETLSPGMPNITHLLITASPFSYGGEKYILLTLEDINDLIALRNFVPICARCKKIKNETNYWIRLERYFKDHLNLDFSHGICPDCSRIMYPTLYGDQDK